MKKQKVKLSTLILSLICVLILVVGCNNNTPMTDEQQKLHDDIKEIIDNVNENAPEFGQFNTDYYKTPAELIDIDFNAKDPSNDKIIFEYDAKGRIKHCYYNIDEHEISIDYEYAEYTTDGREFSVQIIATSSDGNITDYKAFDVESDYDPSGGFSEHSGYYFKGLENITDVVYN